MAEQEASSTVVEWLSSVMERDALRGPAPAGYLDARCSGRCRCRCGRGDGTAHVEESLQESERRFEKMAANVPGVVYRLVVHPDGSFEFPFLSPGAETLIGLSVEEIHRNPARLAEMMHPADRAATAQSMHDALKVMGPWEWEGRFNLASGEQIWLRSAARPEMTPDGGVVWDGVLMDITQHKRTEDLRRERNRLHEAVEAMEKVIGVVGHELRTPLAGLRAMSEFLLTDVSPETDEWHVFLNSIHDEAVRMSETVNDLLEAARLNCGKARWNFSTLSMQTLLHEALDSVRPLLDHAKVMLDGTVDPPDLKMRGDADAIRRLIVNLVNNARKHTQSGEIRVDVRPAGAATAQSGATPGQAGDDPAARIELTVRDTGSGIPPEIVERLGEAFALNAGMVGGNYVGGTGLGLSICKGILAAHGGTMSLRSVVGEGTEVRAVLRSDLKEPVTGGHKIQFVATSNPARPNEPGEGHGTE